MNLIKSLDRLCSVTNRSKPRPFLSCGGLTSEPFRSHFVDTEAIINERTFADISVQQFSSLAANVCQMKDIEAILSHYEYKKYSTLDVPTNLRHDQMKQLLDMSSWCERDQYITELYQKEIKSLIRNRSKQIKSNKIRAKLNQKYKIWQTNTSGIFNSEGQIIYGLWHNSLFTRIGRKHVHRVMSDRLRSAALFGQKVIVDMSAPNYSKQTGYDSKIQQLLDTYNSNRRLPEPFDLTFSNIDFSGIVWKRIEGQRDKYSELPYFMSNFTDKSYSDLFDRQSLVYLTPNATEDLEYECNKIYIIGFWDDIDPNNHKQLLPRNHSIPMRRLPIDRHVLWCKANQDLKAQTVLNVLSAVRQGIDWTTALATNVPKEYLRPKQVDKENECTSQRPNQYKRLLQ